MADTWYVARNGHKAGPYPVAQLRLMAQNGNLSSEDLVWRDGMADWGPASAVPGLFDGRAPQAQAVNYYGNSGAAGGYDWDYGSFWERFGAAFIDGLIVNVGGIILAGIAGGFIGAVMAGSGHSMQELKATAGMIGRIVALLVGWLYMALMESSPRQATLGKMAIGLRVTDLDGRRISFARATGRYFGKWVSVMTLLIGYLMQPFTEKRQALHDLMAGTLVVK